jgi:hypothetical protein
MEKIQCYLTIQTSTLEVENRKGLFELELDIKNISIFIHQ